MRATPTSCVSSSTDRPDARASGHLDGMTARVVAEAGRRPARCGMGMRRREAEATLGGSKWLESWSVWTTRRLPR